MDLIDACYDGNLTALQQLIRMGYPLNAQASRGLGLGLTPLSQVAEQGHAACTMALLDAGADINGTTSHGNTALHYAAMEPSGAILPILLNRGALCNLKNIKGYTPLHQAVSAGNLGHVILLLKSQANPHLKNINEDTPFHVAIKLKQFSILEALAEAGANLQISSPEGQRAEALALGHSDAAVQHFLQSLRARFALSNSGLGSIRHLLG